MTVFNFERDWSIYNFQDLKEFASDVDIKMPDKRNYKPKKVLSVSNSEYHLQKFEESCGICSHAHDDPIHCIIAESFHCDVRDSKVYWNALCRYYERRTK
jgi:hypothetical protein